MNEKLEVDIRVPNQTRYLSLIGKIGEDVARTLKRYHGDRDELAYHINLVLTEAMSNVILHANAEKPECEVHISIAIIEKMMVIRVYDEGEGFEVADAEMECHKTLEEHGRGIFIIRSLMDQVTYRRHNGGHVLEMIKALY